MDVRQARARIVAAISVANRGLMWAAYTATAGGNSRAAARNCDAVRCLLTAAMSASESGNDASRNTARSRGDRATSANTSGTGAVSPNTATAVVPSSIR